MPGNPYQYTGKGEGFLTDYSNLDAAGSALQGFVGAYNDAQDRSMKRMEHEANLEAVKQKMVRERDQSQIDFMKQGVRKTATGDIEEAPLTQRQVDDKVLGASEKGLNVAYDENGHIKSKSWDPTSPQVLGAQAKVGSAGFRERGLDSREMQNAQRQWNQEFGEKSPIVMRAEGANRILDLIKAAEQGKFKTNKAFLGQMNSEVARLEVGAQNPGLGQQQKTEMESSAAEIRAIYDKLANTVSDADLRAQMNQAKAMVGHLRNSYLDAANRKAEELKSGASDTQYSVFDAKHKKFMSNFKPFVEEEQGQAPGPGMVRPSPLQKATPPGFVASPAAPDVNKMSRDQLKQVIRGG